MPFNRFPDIEECCGCVTDLKTAAAIIAVLGIVTSPAVSWAVVRHSYVIRVSCIISSSLSRPDVVDINLNNVLSFGFGTNAGLGPSCLSKNRTKDPDVQLSEIQLRSSGSSSRMVAAVRYVGWAVLIVDLVFLCCSINLLIRIFNGPDKPAAKLFITVAVVAMLLSFIYCMLYVAACMSLGGSFPIIEFLFAFIDLFKWTIWIHLLLVMNTYSKPYTPVEKSFIERWHSRWMKPWINPWISQWICPTHSSTVSSTDRPTTSRRRGASP